MQFFKNIKFCTVQVRDITFHVHLFFLGSDTASKVPYFSKCMLAVFNAALNFARLYSKEDDTVPDTLRQSFSRLAPFHSTVTKRLALANNYGLLCQKDMTVFVQRFFKCLEEIKNNETKIGGYDVILLTGMNFGYGNENLHPTLPDMANFARKLFNHHCFAFSAAGVKSLFQSEKSTFTLSTQDISISDREIQTCINDLVNKLHNYLNLEMVEQLDGHAEMGIYFDFGIEIQAFPLSREYSTLFDINKLSLLLKEAMSCTKTTYAEIPDDMSEESNHLLDELDFFEELDNEDDSEDNIQNNVSPVENTMEQHENFDNMDLNILDRETLLVSNQEIKTSKWLHHSSIKNVGGVNSGSVFLQMSDDNNEDNNRRLQPTRTAFNVQGCQGYMPYLKHWISKSTTKNQIKELMSLADNVQVALSDFVRRTRTQKHTAAKTVIEILDVFHRLCYMMKMNIHSYFSNPCR